MGLQQHPARVPTPDRAEVIFTPTFAALSLAAGTCGGTTHFQRTLAIANTLRGQPWFSGRPQDHLLLNGVASAMRNPLGELGELVSGRGGRAACLDSKLCGFFKAERMLPLPWPPLPALQTRAVRALVNEEACGRRSAGGGGGGAGASARGVTIFYRGTLGRSKESQDLRVRLLMLKQISGSQVSLVSPSEGGSEKLLPTAALYASKHQLSGSRLKRMDGATYASRMLGARFCLCPVGDVATPAGRLFDAIAAGCVPIIIGLVDRAALPLARQIDYGKFAAFVSRPAFMKDPAYAIEALYNRLEPQLPIMRRALADARHRLIWGVTDDGPMLSANGSSLSGGSAPNFGAVAPMLLREHKLATMGTPAGGGAPPAGLIRA